MNRLIIHPKDETTDFLCPIYDHLTNITVVKRNLPSNVMNSLIRCHDQVIMLGHGGPNGLFGAPYPNIIGAVHVEALAEKNNNIFIWCHANQFVEMHKLQGFSTSMFISEDQEAVWCLNEGYEAHVDENSIHEQNELFARIIGENICSSIDELYSIVKKNFTAENTGCFNKSVINYNNNGLKLYK